MDGFHSLFPDEPAARAWFEDGRWPHGRFCPQCGSARTRPVPNERPAPYHCTSCRTYFSVRWGTMLHRSNLPLRKWAMAIHLMSASTGRNGVPGCVAMGRCLDINPRSADMAVNKIRRAVAEQIGSGGGNPDGLIDADVEDIRDALLGIVPHGREAQLPEDWEDLDVLLQESL